METGLREYAGGRFDFVARMAEAVLAAAIFCSAGTLVAAPEKAYEVSQYGITWTFDREVEVGRFVNGDWWVVGPVTVESVSPAPGEATEEEEAVIRLDNWGNTSLRDDRRMRNGSMIILEAGPHQGFDSRSNSYRAETGVGFPLRLEPHRSLVSTISNKSIENQNFVHHIMWSSERTTQVVLNTAAVLTCLEEPPPQDAFRPPYAGIEKPLFRLGDVNWDLLLQLEPVENTPSWEQYERYFERVWLDHIPNWNQGALAPNENQPGYGREHGRITSVAALLVHLDVPRERKEKLVIGLIQRGIDLWGLAGAGAQWGTQGGGHGNGRKWPILFASLMLDEPGLRELPETATFQEDTQTYYGEGWFGQSALYWMVVHHGRRERYEHKPPEEWERWDRSTESYRLCCTAQGWIGNALAARLMGAIEIWNHDAFFDYCDRWMREDDPYAGRRGEHERPAQEGRTYERFVDEMWRAYRDAAPEQPMAGNPRKWMHDEGWVPNPKPDDAVQ